jgi:hypothetical protein
LTPHKTRRILLVRIHSLISGCASRQGEKNGAHPTGRQGPTKAAPTLQAPPSACQATAAGTPDGFAPGAFVSAGFAQAAYT